MNFYLSFLLGLSLFALLKHVVVNVNGGVINREVRSSSKCVPVDLSAGLDVWCNGYTPWGDVFCASLTLEKCKWDDGSAGLVVAPNVGSVVEIFQGNDAFCNAPEGLILVTDTKVQIMSSTGVITDCAVGFFSIVGGVLGKDGSIFVVSDMGQSVSKINPGCGEVTEILTAANGLVRPSAIACIPSPTGYTLVVSNSQGGNSGHAFTFDLSGLLLGSKIIPLVSGGLSHVYFDGLKLFGVAKNKILGNFDIDYNYFANKDIPAIVDVRQIGRCAGKVYLAADDNNDIFQCDELNVPGSCSPLCPYTQEQTGVTNPWSIGVGTDCSIYTASRGPGAGNIFKYGSDTCYKPTKIGTLENGGE
eukprot:Awhi_evm1s9112